MSISNLAQIYDNLPGRYRRADTDLFLKRLLTFAGETLDGYDETFDNFYQQIDPETASAVWVEYWLAALFGWAWFPRWFTLGDKRTLYANFARHLARRGTARGIELWLRDFGIVARVWYRPQAWGEAAWGEPAWSVNHPLGLVIEILHLKDRVNYDASFYGDAAWGECLFTVQRRSLTDGEIDKLVRFVWPLGNRIWLVWSNFPAFETPFVPVNFGSYVAVLPL